MPSATITIDGTVLSAPAIAGGLYIAATPIGNLSDMTIRALKVLAAADCVAAEDTRHTGRLLKHYGISVPLLRYDEHGALAQRPKLLARLAEGAAIALVSDAGTPLISDPGYRLVHEARENGHCVFAVPGPSALLAALSVAGLPSDCFTFAGFLPPKEAARAARIRELAAAPGTLILFEAPHRLASTLTTLLAVLGDRDAVVARELTKRFETVERGRLDELAERFSEPVKGEIVILVAPDRGAAMDEAGVDAALKQALAAMPPGAAAAQVARLTGVDRKALYRRALSLKER